MEIVELNFRSSRPKHENTLEFRRFRAARMPGLSDDVPNFEEVHVKYENRSVAPPLLHKSRTLLEVMKRVDAEDKILSDDDLDEFAELISTEQKFLNEILGVDKTRKKFKIDELKNES